MIYAWAKLLHLFALVLWMGPPLGAYYVLARAYSDGKEERILWAEHVTERVLFFEHIALIALIATGLAMVQVGPWQLFETPWLRTKMMFFAGVLVFEAFDIWLAHFVFAKLLRTKEAFQSEAWTRARKWRNGLIAGALVVGFVFIPAMFYLAIVKT